jgi:hypothetical protein
MIKNIICIVIALFICSCSESKEYELKKYYKDPYSRAAQMMGSTYAGVVEKFNSLPACEEMKRQVEAGDRKIGYTNSRFVCDLKAVEVPNNISRQWAFSADMNSSGSVTIGDVWLWCKWIFFYPGDYLIKILMENIPEVGSFLEISPSWYGGWISGLLSWCFYMILERKLVNKVF